MLGPIVQLASQTMDAAPFSGFVSNQEAATAALRVRPPPKSEGPDDTLSGFALSLSALNAAFDRMCRCLSEANSKLIAQGRRVARLEHSIRQFTMTNRARKVGAVTRQIEASLAPRRLHLAPSQRSVDRVNSFNPFDDVTSEIDGRSAAIQRLAQQITPVTTNGWVARLKKSAVDDAAATRALLVFISTRNDEDIPTASKELSEDEDLTLQQCPQGRLLLRLWGRLAAFNEESVTT